MSRLLLVEDDELLGDGIKKVLSQRGDQIAWVTDGRSALAALADDIWDLLLLDLNLPDMSGFDIVRKIRSAKNCLPILILSARDEIHDRVRALDYGADDYLIKPFDVEELSARIRALLRRAAGVTDDQLHHGELTMNTSTRVVLLAGNQIPLSAREFDLLQILLENRGRVLSRNQLEERLYARWDEVTSNSVEVHIHNIRKKLGSDLIRTLRGVGYLIDKAD
ncbi:MAG: response regulator [Gammaproteobacteria bacterium]|nr:response regulator [Gammaproteobacteria bacterium]MCP5417945.1 response regulator [Chromatiaceae bacterium]